jgi:Flp pilus assembly protein TadG
MSQESSMFKRRAARPRPGGQILVIFVLAMVAMIGMVGLAIDGGATYAQRRDQQTASDLAALAAANDYMLSNSTTQATDRARTVSATNGFTNGVGPTTVGVLFDTSNGVEVTVNVGSAHPNSFLGALGMASWNVSTTATALAGFPDSASGAGPFIFPISAFNDDGTPKYLTPTDFNETNADIPTSQTDIAWTNYGTGNLDTQGVDDIIKGTVTVNETLSYGEYIGQANNGNHNTLYTDVNTYLSGLDLPVAVVDAGGNFMGWATFHVVSAEAGSTKHITGYFQTAFTSDRLTITTCSSLACPRYLGSYILKLTN